jgi:prephenate dehydratase
MATRVSIQGYEGSFHQMAAQQFFGKNVGVIPCATFREVIKLASNKRESEAGVMAIENSIAGSILANYNLLQRSNLVIMGEVYLQIRQNLLVNHGVGSRTYVKFILTRWRYSNASIFWTNMIGSW